MDTPFLFFVQPDIHIAYHGNAENISRLRSCPNSGQHRWEAIGVNFSANAILQAKRNSNGIVGATFVEGDVTKLREVGIHGPFDLG